MEAAAELPKHYDARATEKKWQQYWDERRVYAWDPTRPGPVFAVDTPPPTVSGLIHIGHVFSYTQAEIVVRYKRLRGCNVFYPFGFDDNGLPTERFVEKARGIKSTSLSRDEFIRICLEVSEQAEKSYEELWRSLGLSADWSLTYRTIDARSRRISQRSFLDILQKGRASRRDAPNLWCPQCETGLAQADVEDQELDSFFHEIAFRSESGEDLVIATTRPELIPACVALIHHPEDERYRSLQGKQAVVPISGHRVPVLTDAKVDRAKGTGLVMCCTFGDQTDVEWWRQFQLPSRLTLTTNGLLTASGADLDGLTIPVARKKIVELLGAAGQLRSSRPIRHAVKVHERCKTPVEILCRKQWYVHVLDHKRELHAIADQIRWFPDFMKSRYQDWVENLMLDWCVSRQRLFGVPIPVWYCRSCGGVIPAHADDLPVDPLKDRPRSACGQCGGRDFEPEADVFDTWATSSVTPQINARWKESDDRTAQILPMQMRPQAHDIIRTWAFYTIVKSLYNTESIPWTDAVISGHVKMRAEASRGGQGKGAQKSKLEKISKSRLQGGEVSAPTDLIEEWSADAVRYWTAGASLGLDQAYDLKEMEQGKRLLTKLYNASKFALMHLGDYDGARPAARFPIDAWALTAFARLVRRNIEFMEQFDFFHARLELEQFFWGVFCDNYLELAKARLYNKELGGQAGRLSGQATLYELLMGQLHLFAPFIPHITEEIYQIASLVSERRVSLHVSPYPTAEQYREDAAAFARAEQAVQVLGLVRKYRASKSLSMKVEIPMVQVSGVDFALAEDPALLQDLVATARIVSLVQTQALDLQGEELGEGPIKVRIQGGLAGA